MAGVNEGTNGEMKLKEIVAIWVISRRMTEAHAKIRGLKGTFVEEATSVTASTENRNLTLRDQEILKFEREWWKHSGSKENAIRDLFDMSATRYYQILNALIDTEAALDFDPMLVKRLRRIRLDRQRQRSARRLGITLP